MAVIDSKKLLPPSKSTGSALTTQKFLVPISNIKVKSSAIIKASDITPVENERVGGGKTLLGEFIQIRKNFVSIQKIIADNNSLFKKDEERKRKLLEKEKFAKKEQQLEKKDPKQKTSLSIPSLPRTGFLDAIKRFLFYTLLGAAFVKFGKHIPKILEFSKKLIPAFKFVEDFAGNVLNGVVDFVGAGYKAYDKVREITKQVGGEDLEKKFDKFSKQFNTFANLALIAGMSTMGGTDFSGGGGKPSATKPGFDRVRGGRVSKPTQARYLSRYGKGAFTNRFGQQSLRSLTGKGAGKVAGKILGKVPIIGGLIDFIISTVIFKEKPGRAAAKAVGATIGSALGTFIPVPFAGTILGGVVGDLVGGALYDSLVGNDTLKAKAQGGQVTRGGQRVSGPARRSVKRVRTRPPKIKPQRTIPGKDVGGKEEIKKIFPSPANPSQRNPLGVLETTSKNLKEVPFLGGIMGASVDLAMGQKPDANVFKRIGYGFGALVQNAIDAETSNTIGNIQKEIVGLAGGGAVPRTLSTGESVGMQIGERLGKTLEAMMNSKVTETLQSIRRQFGKEGFGTGTDGDGGGGAGAGTVSVSSDSPDFWLLSVGSLLENSHPQGAADVAQVIYNRVSSPSWPSTIRDVILQGNGGQFQPVRDYGNISAWQSIKDKESAVNFIKRYGKGRTQSQLESVAAALLDTNRQGSARNFVGPRDSFRSVSFEDANNHLADDTEQRRHGHVFGFEPRGAQIASFRAGKLTPAQVSQQTTGTVTQISPQSVSGNVKDTGIRDSSGRPIKLKGIIANAFIDMAAAARKDGIDLGRGISNSFRDPEHNRRVGGSQGSRHLTGEAFDINWNSASGRWIRNNASRFGFRYNAYSSQSTHFDWVGGYSPTSVSNVKTGSNERVSLAPSTSPSIASGLNQKTSYEVAGGSMIMLQKVIIEKPVPMPMSGGPIASIDNSGTPSSTASLAIG
jgi:hypothetical protein